MAENIFRIIKIIGNEITYHWVFESDKIINMGWSKDIEEVKVVLEKHRVKFGDLKVKTEKIMRSK